MRVYNEYIWLLRKLHLLSDGNLGCCIYGLHDIYGYKLSRETHFKTFWDFYDRNYNNIN